MIYYFAFGSNLDETQIKERCPESELFGVAVLKNYRLDFTIYSKKRLCGCADIIKDEGNEVWGLIFVLSEKDLQQLDIFEGTPNYYRRIKVDVIDGAGKSIEVYTYEVANKLPFQAPSSQYFDIIKNASKKLNFPKSYQDLLNNIKIK